MRIVGIVLVATGGAALLFLAEGGWVLKHMAYPVVAGERGEKQVQRKRKWGSTFHRVLRKTWWVPVLAVAIGVVLIVTAG